MKLNNIRIQNYRSIKDESIEFKNNAIFLFGKNETGKSNILKAIAQLNENLADPEVKFNYQRDCKKPASENLDREPTSIKYSFLIEKEERPKILIELIKAEVFNPLDNVEIETIIKAASLKITFEKNSQRNEENYYTRTYKNIKLKDDFVLLKENFPEEKHVEIYGDSFSKEDIYCFNQKDCGNIDAIADFVEPLTLKLFDNDLGTKICNYMRNNTPKIIYWKYKQENLITSPINIDEFIKNPQGFPIFKNIFSLCNLKNDEKIIEILNEMKADPDITNYPNLFKKLAHRTTSHIQDIWKEYQNISIEISYHHPNITFSVRDGEKGFNTYSVLNRSDGFKKFLSLLLTISADYRNMNLQNNLILIDEPESSLDPGSVKYLRDELINISDKNYIVVSSHSVFMVDNKRIKRNYIVEKNDEDTNINQVDENNLISSEVIYKALGTSIFEHIRPNNFLFEGKNDRKIFEILNNKLKEFDLNSFDFETFGICNATGVRKVTTYLNFFQKLVEFITILDDDKDGIEVKNEIKQELDERFYKNTFTYGDIIKHNKKTFTVEDFLPKNLFIKLINEKICRRRRVEYIETLEDDKGYLEQVIPYLYRRHMTTNQVKPDLSFLKGQIPQELYKYIRDINAKDFKKEFKYFIAFVKNVNTKAGIDK